MPAVCLDGEVDSFTKRINLVAELMERRSGIAK
jgi:hypothetical protein